MAKKTATKKLKNRVKIDATEIPMRPAPYLVVGPGRCGSSTVARLLHEHFGVCMGYDFLPPDQDQNPDGNYEDMHIVQIHKALILGHLNYREWIFNLQQIIYNRVTKKKPWGLKDPIMSYFISWWITFFDDCPRIIRCKRDEKLVLKSMEKAWDEVNHIEEAKSLYKGREWCISHTLQYFPHLVVDFGTKKKISDKTIIKMIEDMWPDIYEGDWGCET